MSEIRPSIEPVRTAPDSDFHYPRDRTVVSLFEEIAAKYPENIALSFGESQLTYSQLNVRANRLAHRLRRMGVGPETLVGCCLERSLELVIAFVAVLKAGGAYVPLDPTSPKARLDFQFRDTQLPLILSQRSFASTILADLELPVLPLDAPQTPSAPNEDTNPEPIASPTGLAYVMYTSGSTGAPKGVMIENRSIVRLVRNANYCYFGPEEVFLQLAPISFDASTFEIWGALLNGGRLVVMPPQTPSLEEIGGAIGAYGVTTLWLTSGLFHLMAEQRLDDLKPLRQLLAGGDVLSARHVRRCLEKLPRTTLINGYGPTENTTFTCCHVMRRGDSVPDSVPIGRSVSQTQVFILDSQTRPVGPGEKGEICIAGDGLARGYLNRPQDTAQKFLRNPFGDDESFRLYRTGDLGRWRSDGAIDFLGRTDNQVKILGHRVEPEEIEAAFHSCDAVQQVCVVARDDADTSKRLVACYVPSRNSGLTPGELRAFAVKKLPHYMIPSLFVSLDALPLTPNGKIDRQALAAIEIKAPDQESSGQTSATQLETTLRESWKHILQTSHVGLDDNFFDLGGNSLLLVALHAQLQKTLDADISLTDLFQFPTIRSLARSLAQHLRGEQHPASPSLTHVGRKARQREAFARSRAQQSSELP